MRRISTGIVGREILGRFTAFDNSLRSIENNQDIVLNPNGSGIIRSDAHIQVNDENSVRFADSGSSNYVEIKAPASLSSNISLTLPDGTGSSGDVLTIDSSGNLSFSGINVNVNDQNADTDSYYPLMSTNTSGEIGNLSVSSSKLSFQPSSGTLTAEAYVETSTIRVKENVRPIKDALNLVTQLNGVTYDRITSNKKGEAGLIAEDVYKILPNLVHKDANGEPYAINYTKFTAYLIESVKTLADQIYDLEKNIAIKGENHG